MRERVVEAFRARFGRPPEVVVRAPGRVNLMGEHTDYNDGYVLPAAIDRAAWVAAAPLAQAEARIRAVDLEDEAAFPLSPVPPAQGDWADYPRGVAWALQERGLELAGMEAALTSSVPVGAGLSSSAAVEVAFALAWQALSGLALDRREMARLCQRAENAYVGVRCGILDQMASALCIEGHALLLDCRTLEADHVRLPEDVAIVVVDTGVRRQLAASEYNARRAQCEEAARLLGVGALRDVSLADLEWSRERLPPLLYRRARHVVAENRRVLQAAQALRAGDLATMGALMNECHISLRDDYEVSAPELDTVVEAAWEAAGCYGARLTGAGFGGCAVALVAPEATSDFEVRVSGAYRAAFGCRPEIYVCRADAGAAQIL